MDLETIRLFAITKLGWIREQQYKLRRQERETAREYLERESHYVWGARYLLEIVEQNATPQVTLNHKHIHLRVRPGTDETGKEIVLQEWYRAQLKAAVPPLIAKWEPALDVRVAGFTVRKMKTRWGSQGKRIQNSAYSTPIAEAMG